MRQRPRQRGGLVGGSVRSGAADSGAASPDRERRPWERDHALVDKAPEPLDLRLAAPAGLCWAAAYWAVGVGGTHGWRHVLVAAGASLGAAMLLTVPVRRFRPPRHRADSRPGAPEDPRAAGSVSASLLLCALAVSAVLTVSAAQLWSRAGDPLVLASGTSVSPPQATGAVTLTATVSEQPRVLARAGSTTVVTSLRVHTVEGEPSRLTATVLADAQWLELDMGTQIRVRTRLQPAEAGSSRAAVIGSGAQVQVLAPPSGTLAIVTSLRQGLAAAVALGEDQSDQASRAPGSHQTAPADQQGQVGQSGTVLRWPQGAQALVPGIALGDDHALPTQVRLDMRTVSMTHLTAVSGQHVAIVLGLGLGALGVLPRRWRAVAGAVVLGGLVLLVRPSGSVLRSAAMGGVMLAGVAAGRRSASVPALCAGVLLLLLADPFQARDYGFALSVAATAGILLGARPAAACLSRYLPRWLAAGLALPAVAQAACAPLLVLLQPQVGLWSVPANVLAAPVVPVATVCGITAALVAPLWPAAASVIAWPALASCAWLVVLARRTADLPGSALACPGGVVGALALAGLETVVLGAASRGLRRRAGDGLTLVSRLLSRGRLAPWQPPEPHAPVAGAAHRKDPRGTRSSWLRWSLSRRERRSWLTVRWHVFWRRPGRRTRPRRSSGSRPPPTRPTSWTR
ncbi:ComEC/Rec2 family competence protein [Actinomyces sp. 2119]|uniref:ComEC/Rec2 family competence protein n=1 Tax=Actinomyces sp. 2119 TaxID=2321393 RepID=UPI000E6CB016|nr:ComEC/Rec2 family competence protein [Actinomyces sp. 2119]RJF42467.1 ComEC/Rec2 family competence protein [Actinomyces sp. 2119]